MPHDISKSMREHVRERIASGQLDVEKNTKEKELYDLAFYLYKERRYGREYLRQLVTVACIDADEEGK